MLRALRRAYGGGWRAGMAQQPLICWPNGTKTLATPDCPYSGRWQGLQRFFWHEGLQAGMMKRLTTNLKG